MSFGPNYSFGNIISSTISAHSTQQCINDIRTALTLCRWSILNSFSGFGGTTGYELISFPTPFRFVRMRVKVYWDGTVIPFSPFPLIQIEGADSSGNNTKLVSPISIRSDLGNKTLRIICNQYQCA